VIITSMSVKPRERAGRRWLGMAEVFMAVHPFWCRAGIAAYRSSQCGERWSLVGRYL
jgi:hypothetical protein